MRDPENDSLQRFDGLTASVGDGNPESLRSFFYWLQIDFPDATVTSNVLGPSIILPRKIHKVVTESSNGSQRYTERGNQDRTGKIGRVVSSMMGAEVDVRLRKATLTTPEHKHVLIAVQEMTLLGTSNKLLDKYDQIFLLIPDVLGKLPLDQINQKIRDKVTLVVWNRYAQELLERSGYDVMLVKPWMRYQTSDLIQNPIIKDVEERNNTIYVKTSGSGWPKSWQDNVLHSLRSCGAQFALYQANGSIVTNKHQQNKTIERPFYFDFSNYPPSVLIGYPSELIHVLAAHENNQTRPLFYALPPKGGHELTNLIWAIKQGYCQGMVFPTGYANALPRHTERARDVTTLFDKPELGIFPEALQTILTPDISYERILLSCDTHIPLDVALKRVVFDRRHKITSSDVESDQLGTLSFADQLRLRQSGTITPEEIS